MGSFFAELKRRNVFEVGVAYVVVALAADRHCPADLQCARLGCTNRYISPDPWIPDSNNIRLGVGVDAGEL